MRRYRRVLKSENEEAWKRRAYTAAAPGKFRKNSKIITRDKYLVKKAGGVSTNKQHKIRREKQSSIAQHKAQITRGRTKILRDLMDRKAYGSIDERNKLVLEDSHLIDKYLKVGYKGLTPDEQFEFKNLFHVYPEDIIRGWLDSSEKSRMQKMKFDKRAA